VTTINPIQRCATCASPFGGMKQSGVRREGGEEARSFFTEPKNVCIAK